MTKDMCVRLSNIGTEGRGGKMLSVFFGYGLLVAVLGVAMGGLKRDGTLDTFRRECVSVIFIVEVLIGLSAIVEAFLLVLGDLFIIRCVLGAYILFACVVLSWIVRRDDAGRRPFWDTLDAALENLEYRSHCIDMSRDAYQRLVNNGFLFVTIACIVAVAWVLFLRLFS